MSQYLGFVTIMVNVASEWGLTKREYTQLQELYNKYQKDGLRIVAFPSNEFGNQEPGDNSVIEDFVTQKFGVTFDMMAKTTVNGDHPEPVIAWAKNHPNGSGFLFNTIKWVRVINFSLNWILKLLLVTGQSMFGSINFDTKLWTSATNVNFCTKFDWNWNFAIMKKWCAEVNDLCRS